MLEETLSRDRLADCKSTGFGVGAFSGGATTAAVVAVPTSSAEVVGRFMTIWAYLVSKTFPNLCHSLPLPTAIASPSK